MVIGIATNLQPIYCWTCGILFAIPARWLEGKIEEEESIQCPNGHETSYAQPQPAIDAEALKASNEELRRELLLEKHNAEQAEGRAREESPTVKSGRRTRKTEQGQ